MTESKAFAAKDSGCLGHLRSAAVGGAVAIWVADKNTAPGAVAAPAVGGATIVAVAAELCPECKESGYFSSSPDTE
jgi:hypothetical protein